MRYILTLLICLASCQVWAVGYGSLDNRARTISTEQAATKEQLVAALTQGIEDPADKARVIAAWIAYQVDRNGFEYKKLVDASNRVRLAAPPLANDVFKSRIGTPQEFAMLFQELATLAGLESVVIEGYAGRNIPSSRYEKPLMKALEPNINRLRGGNFSLQRYIGAWNAVKINEEWLLLDTYWMVRGEQMVGQNLTRRAMESLLKRRTRQTPSATILTRGKVMDDDYFFPYPRDFIKTHFPIESEWQLLPVPKTWANFTN